MLSCSISAAAVLILAVALSAAVMVISRMKRQRDTWARIMTRLWDED